LITNGALRYSPDELELYLIDFKKGVEFKVYAAMELPHARVIAIESEREFGLSVLQRLDGELKERGEIYRQFGVQDLAGYREARPEVFMPRILLVIDEFQEFFIETTRSRRGLALLDRWSGKVMPSACTSSWASDPGRFYRPSTLARWSCGSPCNAARLTPT
jgi:hypothetical protein